MRYTPDDIVPGSLGKNEIFVFGSNEAGIHGAGAAKAAVEYFGAKMYKGHGMQGKSYALPTKDKRLYPLHIDRVKRHVQVFIAHAKRSPDKTYLVTKIGCGYAGFTPEQIAPLFKDAPDNVILPETFHNILNN